MRIREHFSPRLMKSLPSSGLRSGSPYLSAEGFLSLLMGNSATGDGGGDSQRDCDTKTNLKGQAPSSLAGPRMPDGPRRPSQHPSAGQEPGLAGAQSPPRAKNGHGCSSCRYWPGGGVGGPAE